MSLNIISVIFRKELKDTLRDKRSFFISVIFPVILFPLIFSVLDVNIQKANSKIKENMKIGLIDSEDGLIGQLLEKQDKFIIEKDPDGKLKSGELYAVIKSVPFEGKNRITVIYDNSRQQSVTAASQLTALLTAFSESNKTSKSSSAFVITQELLYSKSTGNSMLILSTLLPFLMFVFAALSPVALASDTGAGEKERYTLEPLLTNPVSKKEILAGKYLCLIVMGLIGTTAFAAGIIISTVLTPDVFGFEKLDLYIKTLPAILLFLTALLLTMLFSSAELMLSFAARSPKEAQVFFLPLMMITMTAGYSTSVIDPLNIDSFYRHIPLLNISILIKEVSLNIINPKAAFITVLWTAAYIMIFILISKILISSESIVKRE